MRQRTIKTNSESKQRVAASSLVYKWLTQYLKPFVTEWVKEPRAVGALCPSSRGLANAMANQVDTTKDGYYIELGAGTGVVTQALLDRGIDPSRLVVIERSPRFADLLKVRFSDLNVIKGDATELSSFLMTEFGFNIKVASIISSLPLRSLAKETKASIINEWATLLDNEGQVIQFSYFLLSSPALHPDLFQETKRKLILRNIPPAKAFCYTRLKSPILGS